MLFGYAMKVIGAFCLGCLECPDISACLLSDILDKG